MASIRFVRSDGVELEATDEPGDGWKVGYDGLEDFVGVSANVRTSANVLTDGSTFLSERIDERERESRIFYVGARDPREVRDEALSFFNPKHAFRAHVTHMGVTRWCEGRLVEAECPLVRGNRPCEVSVTLLCLDPYMLSEDGNESSLTDAAPMFGFPYVSHFREALPDGSKMPVGSLASKMLYDGLNTIYNTGDVETYYRIHCEFMGEVQNPSFTKDEKFVKLNYLFEDGDVLDIDFTVAPPKVTINGVNAIGYCTRDSTFTGMAMGVGPNVFDYSCTNDGKEYMSVQILFYKRYLGI